MKTYNSDYLRERLAYEKYFSPTSIEHEELEDLRNDVIGASNLDFMESPEYFELVEVIKGDDCESEYPVIEYLKKEFYIIKEP